jgi:hypothetical protein
LVTKHPPAIDAASLVSALKNKRPATVGTKNLKYQTRFVLFLDFLGFTDIVAKTRKGSRNHEVGLIGKIRNAMLLPIPTLDQSVPSGLGFKQSKRPLISATTFSDFTIAVATHDDAGFVTLVKLATDFYLQALQNGFACRGGISLGEVYCESEASAGRNIIFGPAFLDAYQLEHAHAQSSRIVLSNSAASYFKECAAGRTCPIKAKAYLKNLIQQDKDGPFRIYPFRDLAPLENAHERLEDIHKEIREMLEKYTESPRVFSKLRRLAEEFNNHMGTIEAPEKLKLILPF